MNNNISRRPEARQLIIESLNKGEMIRPDRCEVCGANKRIWDSYLREGKIIIVAHHWRGYDFPLDVWWVCQSCNALLRGFHDGSITKDQFIGIMKNYDPLSRACLKLNVTRQTILEWVKRGKYPGAKQLSTLTKATESPYTDPWFIPKSLLPVPPLEE